MATDGDLRVKISANVQDLKKGLVQAEKGIKKFGNSTDQMAAKTKRMTGGVVRGAVPAMTSFSQVIQDAPFGIRGVANNIQQLTMQMGHLSANAGGTGKALKAMASTLMGPAGILLAVSLVTSLLVSYGDELANIGSASAKVAKEHEKLVESLGQTSDVLSAQIGALDAQIELLKAQGLTADQLLAKKLKLLKTDLQTTVSQRANLYMQLQALKTADMQLTIWEKTLNLLNLAQGRGAFEVGGLDDDDLAKYKELEISIANTDKIIAQLALSIGKIEIPDIFDPKKVKAKGKETRDVVENVTTEIADTLSAGLVDAAPTFTLGADFYANLLNQEALDEQLQSMKDRLMNFNASAQQIIAGSIADTFMGLGEAIGVALATGGNVFDAIGKTILQGLTNFMGEMGRLLIEYGTLAVLKGKLDLAILAGGPVAIGAGLAAIAVGTALVAASAALGSFATSGGGSEVSNSSGADTSFRGSRFSSSGVSSGGGHYVFEIQGTKLVGVLRNTLNRNSALGGNLNITG